MLYYLIQFSDQFGALNVFRYITFRTGGAIMTAMVFMFIFGPGLIAALRIRQGKGQPIREDGPASHVIEKQGTPTMGGVMILMAWSTATLLWSNLANHYVWIVFWVTMLFGMIGFYDDFLKVSKQSADHFFNGKIRLTLEMIIAGCATWLIMMIGKEATSDALTIPFLKDTLIHMGPFYLVFGIVVIIGSGNAVNLTDGLDGLAIVPVMIAAATFALIAYLVGNIKFAEYLQIHYVPGTGELAVMLGAMVGAGLGFLWFNAPPAMIFMGDTGSLALGGLLGAVAVVTKHEIVLGIVGGLFVVEAVSVIIQVAYFKRTGKRVFLMAPLHHHYEQKGWNEPTIVIRFWIVSVILALIGLATLKLR